MATTNYTLAANQANSTVTLATIGTTAEPWTFTCPPGATIDISLKAIFTAAATTTGISLSALVANPFGAERTALGFYQANIQVDAALTATGVTDGDQVSVATNTSTSYTVTSASSTAGNMTATYALALRNFSSNQPVTITLQFASEVAASAVTLLSGTTAIGVTS